MKSFLKGTAMLTTASVAMVSSSHAAEILVSSDISTSTTWTADNTYNLQQQIYVLPGATLTIEAGTVIASDTNIGGSLAVTKGAQIFVQGTQDEPVIMTSKADVATWVGGDPKTGTWREGANEWGNLTIMGAGYISEDEAPTGLTNSPVPSATNVADMEGLVPSVGQEELVQYGGGDDDDDSGVINFLSLRYGGKVAALNKELNGLSLGGIGRETDVHHVEIMNNVDDGIEVWGGTVNLKYINIWNIGDDSFDIDQGWRGKAQFGLIVQGYSVLANQGSGVGDNAIETDGAEDSDWQPVTTAEIRNFTVVGQPLVGDGGTAWRDNARIRYVNCIWQDLGDQLVRFDNDDGDGASGYGHNGTLSWADTWTTAHTATSAVNAPANPADFYKAHTAGNLAQITNSVFFRNLAGGGTGSSSDPAYSEATARGVFDVGNNNLVTSGFDDADGPLTLVTRGALVSTPPGDVLPVIKIDPTPQNDALATADLTADEFFTATGFRGGFAPNDNWLTGWTAADAFGFVDNGNATLWKDEGFALPAVANAGTADETNSYPVLEAIGQPSAGSLVTLNLRNANESALAGLFLSAGLPGGDVTVPFKGGIIKTFLPITGPFILNTFPNGTIPLAFPWFGGITGLQLNFQYGISDPDALIGVSISNVVTTVSL